MKNKEVFRTIRSLLGGLAAFALTVVFNLPLLMMILIPIAVYVGVYLISKPVIKIGSLKLSDVKGEEMKSLMKDAYETWRFWTKPAKCRTPRLEDWL